MTTYTRQHPVLRLTHADKKGSGYYIRFAANTTGIMAQEEWEAFRDALKKRRGDARWDSMYRFADGKVGAWFVPTDVLDYHRHRFTNYDDKIQGGAYRGDARDLRWAWDILGLVAIPHEVRVALITLGLPDDKRPDEADLKKRHHELVKRHHPDRGGDLQRMQKINAAHDQVVKWLAEQRVAS